MSELVSSTLLFPVPTLEGSIFRGFLETFVNRDGQCLELNKALSLGAAKYQPARSSVSLPGTWKDGTIGPCYQL